MPTTKQMRITARLIIDFDSADAIERFRDCLQDGYNATPRNQLFSEDVLDAIEELNEMLARVR